MKNNILSTLFFFLLFSQNIFAQILEPISWEFQNLSKNILRKKKKEK